VAMLLLVLVLWRTVPFLRGEGRATKAA